MPDHLSKLMNVARAMELDDAVLERALAWLIADGGIDMEGLTTGDLRAALADQEGARWHDVAFGINETYAGLGIVDYSNPAFRLDKVPALAVFAGAFMYANCVSRGHGDWDFMFLKVLIAVARTTWDVDIELSASVVKVVCDSVAGSA